jgi:hypothetical protein
MSQLRLKFGSNSKPGSLESTLDEIAEVFDQDFIARCNDLALLKRIHETARALEIGFAERKIRAEGELGLLTREMSAGE